MDTAGDDYSPLPCGCAWVTKWCDEKHWEIREDAERAGVERDILAEAMDYFMAHEGVGHVVEALAQRRETGTWPMRESAG